MKDIKIIAIDSVIKNIEDFKKYIFLDKIGDKTCNINFIWDEINPDYIFATHMIYRDPTLFRKFRKYLSSGRVTIFWGGECVSPDLNIFDYSIVYDEGLQYFDRVCKFPVYLWYLLRYGNSNKDFINAFSSNDAEIELKNKHGFCNFIYSNPVAHPYRDILYSHLSKYKKVDSLGHYLHNTDVEPSRDAKNWLDINIDLKSNYKFSVAAENTYSPGYTTEKIMTSFHAHSIPIYWGNPLISKAFNSKAFINCHDYPSLDDIVNKVKEIDNSDEQWCNMVSEPWQTDEQIAEQNEQIKQYYNFINNIFIQDLSVAKRTSVGPFPNIYLSWFKSSSTIKNTINLAKIYLKNNDYIRISVKRRGVPSFQSKSTQPKYR